MSEDKVVKLGAKRNNKKEATEPTETGFVPSRELINCSFCGRSSAETLKMVKGVAKVLVSASTSVLPMNTQD